jgi:hypothetical protein
LLLAPSLSTIFIFHFGFSLRFSRFHVIIIIAQLLLQEEVVCKVQAASRKKTRRKGGHDDLHHCKGYWNYIVQVDLLLEKDPRDGTFHIVEHLATKYIEHWIRMNLVSST